MSAIDKRDTETLRHLADSMGCGRTHDAIRRVLTVLDGVSTEAPLADAQQPRHAEWDEPDYRRARNCMFQILGKSFDWPLQEKDRAVFDNAFQHAVGILALTARLRPVSEGQWRTIDTAPRDGTTIIIVKADAEEPDACMAHFRNGMWACMTAEDWEAGSWEVRDFAWYLNDATHWMPRPVAPASAPSTNRALESGND